MRFIQVRQFRLTPAAVALAILGLATVCQADVDKDAVLKCWQKFKPGSSATMVANIGAGGYSMQMSKKESLVEVSSDKVVIETTVSMNMGGTPRSNPPVRRTISPGSERHDEMKEVGHEKVEAAGKTWDCDVLEGSAMLPARGGPPTASKARIWINTDVPGGVVKIAVTGGPQEIVYLLSSYEVK